MVPAGLLMWAAVRGGLEEQNRLEAKRLVRKFKTL